jgi:hypothetical protein
VLIGANLRNYGCKGYFKATLKEGASYQLQDEREIRMRAEILFNYLADCKLYGWKPAWEGLRAYKRTYKFRRLWIA